MKPHVIVAGAVSVDGRMDWFSTDYSQFYEQMFIYKSDAVLAGCNTMIHTPFTIPPETKDDLVPPHSVKDDQRPLLAVADSRGRMRNWHFWRRQKKYRDFVALCTDSTPQEYFDYLDERSLSYLVVGEDHIDCPFALEKLNAVYNINVVRILSGGVLNGILLRKCLVDEVIVFLHPELVGGMSQKSFFVADDLDSPDGVIKLRLKDVLRLRNDVVLLTYDVVKR